MRRKDREITDICAILELVSECKVCRLAMTDGGVPYIVPLNYGYEYADGALTFYFHSAKEEPHGMPRAGRPGRAC